MTNDVCRRPLRTGLKEAFMGNFTHRLMRPSYQDPMTADLRAGLVDLLKRVAVNSHLVRDIASTLAALADKPARTAKWKRGYRPEWATSEKLGSALRSEAFDGLTDAELSLLAVQPWAVREAHEALYDAGSEHLPSWTDRVADEEYQLDKRYRRDIDKMFALADAVNAAHGK